MSSLDDLIEQIQRLPQIPPTLSRRIELCTQALKQVSQKTHSVLWAQLHVELGLCLQQMSKSNRAEHLEEALGHFQAALTFYTRQKYPEAWAETIHNLATIYTERIRGERAENLEQAIHLYGQALEIHRRDILPEEWASTQYNLANVYVQRIKGDQADNLEKAIALYESTWKVWKREKYPFDWARVQKGLGVAYTCRVQGNLPDNLQTAISCFNKALTVWLRDKHPSEWAETQEGLGIAWRNNEDGDPVTNVEQAITCHQAALEVWTRESYPWDWARAQHNLGNAWRSRLRGNSAKNLEEAIHCYELALTVRTQETHPEMWAETSHNLAVACSLRFTTESLEKAIRLHEQVLIVHTRQAFPLAWARAQSELGNAYTRSIQGERAANFERAIEYYKQALQVQSKNVCPQDWARTQQNLAVAFSERPLGDRTRNLREAIEHYGQALQVFSKRILIRWATAQISLADTCWKLGNLERATQSDQAAEYLDQAVDRYLEVVSVLDSLPPSSRWALAHYNLGNAYGDRIRGDRAENQERSIEHYNMALKFYTPEVFPDRWANSHNNLAVTYLERQRGERAENLAQAIDHFELALQITTPGQFPIDARRAARNLAHLLFTQRRWGKAIEYYAMAIEASEYLYRETALDPGRHVELREVAEVIPQAAYCLARLGQLEQPRWIVQTLVQRLFKPLSGQPKILEPYQQAVQILEQGRARALAEVLARDRAALDQIRPDDRTAFDVARDRITQIQAEARPWAASDEYMDGRSYSELSANLYQARAELNAIVLRIQSYLPDFVRREVGFVDIIRVAQAQNTPLVYLATTTQGSVTLIVSPLAGVSAVWADDFKTDNLIKLLLPEDEKPNGYLVGTVVGNRTELQRVLPEVLDTLRHYLIIPLVKRLRELGASSACLIPTGRLALLPLHAAAIDEEIIFSYAPSARALAAALDTLPVAPPQTFLALVDPPHRGQYPLPFAPLEVNAIQPLFRSQATHTLNGSAATLVATRAALDGEANGDTPTYLHFSCHGIFNPNKPLESGLALSGDDWLTLAHLLDKLKLSGVRLAVLSACQTALTDFQHAPDEAIGLPAGFLQAGVSGVVGTLWSVEDLSTALLIERFYCYHLKRRLPPPLALHYAQIWLREKLTLKKFVVYLKRHEEHLRATNRSLYIRVKAKRRELEAEQEKHNDNDNIRPFAHPYYWAAFTMTGV